MFYKFYAQHCKSHLSSNVGAAVSDLDGLKQQFVSRVRKVLTARSSGVSMARLQGYLMRHKHSPHAAVDHTLDLFQDAVADHSHNNSNGNSNSNSKSSGKNGSPREEVVVDGNSNHNFVHGAGRRIMSVADIDRMPFNPQPGWDRGIKSI